MCSLFSQPILWNKAKIQTNYYFPVLRQIMKQNTCNKDKNSYIHKTEFEWHHCSKIPWLLTRTYNPGTTMVSVQSQKIKTCPTTLDLFKKQRNWFYSKYRCTVQCIKPHVRKCMIKTNIIKFNYFGKINGIIFRVILVIVCKEAIIFKTSSFCVRNVPNTTTIVSNMYS